MLDVTFKEYLHRARTGFAAQNFSVVRHITLNMLKLETSMKDNPTGKRQRAGWDNGYLLKILRAGAALKDSGA